MRHALVCFLFGGAFSVPWSLAHELYGVPRWMTLLAVAAQLLVVVVFDAYLQRRVV